MVTPDNIYTKMQKGEYERDAHIMNIEDHSVHNDNPDYWNCLLGPISSEPEKWAGKNALDFGCGTGRNVRNMRSLADWNIVCGVDISENNLAYAAQRLIDIDRTALAVSDGVSVPHENNFFDFAMSTIVLQHICVYDIRKSILNDIFRVLKWGGLLSLQMGYGMGHPSSQPYYANFYEAQGTNSQMDVRVEKPEELVNDLYTSGFKQIDYEIRNSWSDSHHEWIYVKAWK